MLTSQLSPGLIVWVKLPLNMSRLVDKEMHSGNTSMAKRRKNKEAEMTTIQGRKYKDTNTTRAAA
jgi:hypothetical protein